MNFNKSEFSTVQHLYGLTSYVREVGMVIFQNVRNGMKNDTQKRNGVHILAYLGYNT